MEKTNSCRVKEADIYTRWEAVKVFATSTRSIVNKEIKILFALDPGAQLHACANTFFVLTTAQALRIIKRTNTLLLGQGAPRTMV